jgi:hypothetical protein
MSEIVNQFGEWLLSVVEHYDIIIASGLVALLIDWADRFWEWKMPNKWYVRFVALGFFFAMFASWRQEHLQAHEKLTYLEIDAHAPVSRVPIFKEGEVPAINLGVANRGDYIALDGEVTVRLEPYKLDKPWVVDEMSGPPTTEAMEKEVFQKLKADTKNESGSKKSYLPKNYGAWTKASMYKRLTKQEEEDFVGGKQIAYAVGFAKWKDAAGTHEQKFCYIIVPPATQLNWSLSVCNSQNDFLMVAVD